MACEPVPAAACAANARPHIDLQQFEDLRREVLRSIATEPGANCCVPGYLGTLGEVAAFMVSSETISSKIAARRLQSSPEAVYCRLVADAKAIVRLLLTQTQAGNNRIFLSRHLGTPDPGEIWVLRTLIENRVSCRGGSGFLSKAVPGVTKVLPPVSIDCTDAEAELQRYLIEKGATAETASAARVVSDGRSSVQIRMPSPDGDRRLDLCDAVRDAAHWSNSKLSESLAYFANRAAIRDRHLARAHQEMAMWHDLISEHIEGVDGLRLEDVSLYTADCQSRRSLAEAREVTSPNFVFHCLVRLFNDALESTITRIVFTSACARDQATSATRLQKLVLTHKRNLKAIHMSGQHLRYESTALALLKAANADLQEIEQKLRTTPNKVKVSADRKSWVSAKNGRVTLRMPLSDTVTWKHDQVEVSGISLPKSILISLPGEPACRVVEHPALAGAIIRSANATRRGFRLRVEPRWVPR